MREKNERNEQCNCNNNSKVPAVDEGRTKNRDRIKYVQRWGKKSKISDWTSRNQNNNPPHTIKASKSQRGSANAFHLQLLPPSLESLVPTSSSTVLAGLTMNPGLTFRVSCIACPLRSTQEYPEGRQIRYATL